MYSATVFADNYNNATGGCFALHCAVGMADGSARTVGDIVAGDIVATGDAAAPTARVRCVVQYNSPVRVLTLPYTGPPGGPTAGPTGGPTGGPRFGATITPWHPVRVPARGGAWEFPARLGAVGEAVAASVRTFVLESGHTMVIDGTVACTLGHGFTEAVVAHAFYGTEAVVKDLSRFPGWRLGFVGMRAEDQVLDATGVVVGYRPGNELAAALGAFRCAPLAVDGASAPQQQAPTA